MGDRVRIEREETRRPSRGTWPRFRGNTGVIVQVNVDRQRPRLTEYGVALGWVAPRTDGRTQFSWDPKSLAWFQVYEMYRLAPQAA